MNTDHQSWDELVTLTEKHGGTISRIDEFHAVVQIAGESTFLRYSGGTS